MSRYTSATDADREADAGGDRRRLGRRAVRRRARGSAPRAPAELADGLPETEVYERLRALAARNADAESELCFLGGGMYDHYVPAIIDAITSRSEFLTPYTPYQPEISQGGLQTMFEFQTAMSELTALPVSSAGLYEGPSTVASAGYLAMAPPRASAAASSSPRGLHPHSRATLDDLLRAATPPRSSRSGLERRPHRPSALAEERSTIRPPPLFVQNPNYLGSIEDLEPSSPRPRTRPARCCRLLRPISLGVLRPPGECGADVAVGEGQPLGGRLDYGGPSFGFFCATERAHAAHAGPDRRRDDRRRRPPRLRPLAADPRAAHPPREGDPQHLHRAGAERARRDDLPELARQAGPGRARRAARPPHRLRPLAPRRGRRASSSLHEAPVLREFAVSLDAPVEAVLDHCAERGIAAGIPLDRDYPELGEGLLVAITEQRTAADIDRLASALERRRRRGPRLPARPSSRGGGSAMSRTPTTDTDAAAVRRDAPRRPMQRDRAVTIYERSVARPPRRRLPDAGVPRRRRRSRS